jgi:hypothetical protein
VGGTPIGVAPVHMIASKPAAHARGERPPRGFPRIRGFGVESVDGGVAALAGPCVATHVPGRALSTVEPAAAAITRGTAGDLL